MQQTITSSQHRSHLEQLHTNQLPALHQDRCCEKTLGLLSAKGSHCIVLTDNPCPCYLETILELKPWALVGSWDAGHSQGLEIVASGERYFSTPAQRSALTRAEREVLRLIAVGLETKTIARRLGNCPATVSVHTRSIYSKLRAAYPQFSLENHVHLTHFWRGQWQLLEGLYTR